MVGRMMLTERAAYHRAPATDGRLLRMTKGRPGSTLWFRSSVQCRVATDRPSAAPGSLDNGRTRRGPRQRRAPASSADPRTTSFKLAGRAYCNCGFPSLPLEMDVTPRSDHRHYTGRAFFGGQRSSARAREILASVAIHVAAAQRR